MKISFSLILSNIVILTLAVSSECAAEDGEEATSKPTPTTADDDAAGTEEMPFTWSCDEMTPDLCSDLVETTGRVATRGGISIKYWKYSSPVLQSNKHPVVVINGGPGFPHNYNLPLRKLACEGREVIFYDQGGVGESSIPEADSMDDYPFLLDIKYFAEEELPALLEALNLSNNKFHITSDSFGTMIAMHYATYSASSSTAGLASLVLNSPIPSAVEYYEHGWDPEDGTIGSMNSWFQQRYKALADIKAFESEEFLAMEETLSANFMYRSGVIPDCALQSVDFLNREQYVAMQGPSEYLEWSGTLRTFDLYSDIQHQKGIMSQIPVLLTAGDHDIVRPRTLKRMNGLLPLSEISVIPHSGHALALDGTDILLSTMEDFLNRVEASDGGTFSPKKESSFSLSSPGEKAPSSHFSPGTSVLLFVVIAVVSFIIGFFYSRRFSRRKAAGQQYETIA